MNGTHQGINCVPRDTTHSNFVLEYMDSSLILLCPTITIIVSRNVLDCNCDSGSKRKIAYFSVIFILILSGYLYYY